MTTKRVLSMAALGLLALALMAVAWPPVQSALLGVRPGGEFPMLLRLNGSPVVLGVITSAGASTTNASTAVPFTITSGEVIDVLCDAAAWCKEASSVSATYTAATMGLPQTAATDRFWILNYSSSATTTFACFGTAAFNCTVFKMQ